MYIKRKARVKRPERSVLHDLFPVSIRLSIATITIETGTPTEKFRGLSQKAPRRVKKLERFVVGAFRDRIFALPTACVVYLYPG